MNSNKNLLVIGGSGFIGNHIVNRAIDIGWNVTSFYFSNKPLEKHPNLSLFKIDINNKEEIQKHFSKKSYDYIVNCGGYIDHSLFSDGGLELIDTHFIAIKNIVNEIDKTRIKKFINIGSSDEYGNNAAPQNEDFREEPISPYSMGKLATTHLLQMLHRTEVFPSTTLRLFLAYGPGQGSERFLPQIIKKCLKNEKFPVSEGRQIRDFCFISDIIDAIFLTLDCEESNGEVINVASGIPLSIKEVIELTQSLIRNGEPKYGEIPYRIGENMNLYAEISKAKNILGWKPKTSIEEGISQTIEWIKATNY